MDAKDCKTQRGDAPYIGMVNGVKGAAADFAFIEYGKNRPMMELLEFTSPKESIVRVYRPGGGAYTQIGYHTPDIRACYDRMIEKGLAPLESIREIDYGSGKGQDAFLLRDPDDLIVQIVQDEANAPGVGRIIDQDRLVLSIPNLDETIPVFRDLLCCDVSVEDTSDSVYLASYCEKPVGRVAVCSSRLERYTVELWETGNYSGIEELYISVPGNVHLCFLCQGIDDLYERFSAAGMRFVNKPVTVTKGINEGSKAIFFRAPGYLWIELLCKEELL
jgi:hypothetical protein